jgi:hypothetical protein
LILLSLLYWLGSQETTREYPSVSCKLYYLKKCYMCKKRLAYTCQDSQTHWSPSVGPRVNNWVKKTALWRHLWCPKTPYDHHGFHFFFFFSWVNLKGN